MLKRMLMTGLMVAVVLSASACGKDSGATSGNATDTPVESPVADFQPAEIPQSTEAGTQASVEESPQPTEEPADEVSASWIFSEMPIAAFEITGWGVGPDIPVYDEHVIGSEDGYDYGVVPYVQLTPSENTFVLYCFSGGDDSDNGADYGVSLSTVHSPSGSSPWKANYYSCLDGGIDLVPEGWVWIEKYYDEFSEEDGGRYMSLVDPWTKYIRFSEIYHSDAPQPDSIYVIEVETFKIYEDEYAVEENVVSAMVEAFEERGATVQEIPVEDALARDNIIVSEEGAD